MHQNSIARVLQRRLFASPMSSRTTRQQRQISSVTSCHHLTTRPAGFSHPQSSCKGLDLYYVDDKRHRRHRRLGQSWLSTTTTRWQSTLTTNTFWKRLDNAVENGDGDSAQEIVEQVVQEYRNRLQNGPMANGTTQKQPLDIRMFSMVLLAFRNGPCATVESALQAQKLLSRMFLFSEKGVIFEKPSISDYLTVLECWNQVSEKDNTSRPTILELAEEFWKSVPEEAVSKEYEERLYRNLLGILANSGQGERAEAYLEEYKQHQVAARKSLKMQSPVVSSEMCLLVLQAYTQSTEARSLEKAGEFLSRMHTDSHLPRPTSKFYNTILEAWASPSKQRDFAVAAAGAERLLDEMKEARVQPDALSYQYKLDILGRLGEGIRAEGVLTNLLKEYTNEFDADLKPDIKPFRTVLWAYSNSHHPDAATHAELVLNNMQELSESDFDTAPTTWDYNLVLKCWSRSRMSLAVERAMNLYGKMVSASSPGDDTLGHQVCSPPKPDITSLNTLLHTSGKHEQAFQLEKLLWKFLDWHANDPSMKPCPDAVSFSIVMKAWSKSGDPHSPERAEKLMKKLENLYLEGRDQCKPDAHIYSLLMSCWAKSKRKNGGGRAESILKKLLTMAQSGEIALQPDAVMWNTAINAQGGDGPRAEALFLEMVQAHRTNPVSSAEPTLLTLTSVMNAWAKTKSKVASERAVNLLRKLQRFHEEGVIKDKPNVVCYSLVLETLALDRTVQSAIHAQDILEEMQASDDPRVQPNVVSYNCVIKAWAFSGHPEAFARASSLLKDVIRQSGTNPKMKPTTKTFGGVLKSLAESSMPHKKKPAEALLGLMKRYACEPDQWTRNVLADCLNNKRGSTRDSRRRQRQEQYDTNRRVQKL